MLPPAPRPPALPRALARRVDRLAAHAHAFHRWAHHPLCREYAGEVFRLGRRFRLCRGCTLAALGALSGVALGLAVPPGHPELLAALAALGTIPALLGLSHLRLPKPLTRSLPAALPPFLLIQAGRHPSLPAGSLAVLAWVGTGLWVRRYRRRGPDRSPCAACPEQTAPGICRGFREIRTRERAFSRLSSRWIRQGSGTMGG